MAVETWKSHRPGGFRVGINPNQRVSERRWPGIGGFLAIGGADQGDSVPRGPWKRRIERELESHAWLGRQRSR